MKIDITQCSLVNIVDSCSIWNIISSILLHGRLSESSFDFSITKFVQYECLHKIRNNPSERDIEIRERLVKLQSKSHFPSYKLTIEDLQDEEIKKYNLKLGIGELSSIAFCKKTNQVFLSDDQKARKMAQIILGKERVQTVPQILGWMYYRGLLGDAELEPIIAEHNYFQRPLEPYFREVYQEALRIKCLFNN